MFDIGMSEVLVIAVVAIIVVGPKDLPGLLKTAARYMGQIRSMARDFQSQVNDAIRDTELDTVRDTVKSVGKSVGDLNPLNDIKKDVSNYMDSARAHEVPDEEPIVPPTVDRKTPASTASTNAIDAGVPPVTPPSPATAALAPSVETPARSKPAKASAPAKPLAVKPAVKPAAAKPAPKKVAARAKKTESGSSAS